MALYKLARFAVRPDADQAVERALHEFASFVRAELPGWSWTAYRDPHAPSRYVAMIRADDAAAEARYLGSPGAGTFGAALAPLLVGPIEFTDCALVTSSDLGRRPAPQRAGRRPRRP